jgi:hypothetical protein
MFLFSRRHANDPSRPERQEVIKMKRKKLKSSRGASLATRARPYADAALAELVRIMMRSHSDSARVAASIALLDRGFGKPPPSQNLATTDVVPPPRPRANMSIEEVRAEFRRLRAMPASEFFGGQK